MSESELRQPNMSKTRYPFTPKMLEELKQLYPTTKADHLAIKFNCPLRRIRNLVHQHGLKKDMNWVRENARINMMRPDHPGRTFLFKPGRESYNKGMKQEEYMTPEAIEITKITRFKEGQMPWNHKHIGHERINSDGYVFVKIAEPNVFELKQRLTWEIHKGKIPKGYNVQFRDGNPTNCDDIKNLYLISRKDQLKTENSMYARYPKELQLAIQAKGALNRQINKLLKQA